MFSSLCKPRKQSVDWEQTQTDRQTDRQTDYRNPRAHARRALITPGYRENDHKNWAKGSVVAIDADASSQSRTKPETTEVGGAGCSY